MNEFAFLTYAASYIFVCSTVLFLLFRCKEVKAELLSIMIGSGFSTGFLLLIVSFTGLK